MKKSKISEVPKESAASPLFTSDDVYRQPLASDSNDFNASVVGFGHGVRNKFHTHTSDQLLIVTHGKGVFATEAEQVELEPGDVIFSPGGEKHWHGADGEHDFAHITVTRKDSVTTQHEE
jgi:quercetin dioxygenase-like cupin family protein